MPKHTERMSRLSWLIPPPEGTLSREKLENWVNKNPAPPELKKVFKKLFKKATTTVLAQLENGAGFPMDIQIREYLLEYNDRFFRHGPHSLPSSFNILEAFFHFKVPERYLRLREEKDHLLSFVEFFDYVTSKESTDDVKDTIEYIDEGIIYSYNAINNPSEITFTIEDGNEYGIGGATLIRYGSEINIMMLAGEKTDIAKKSEELTKVKPLEPYPGKENIRPSDDLKREAVPLTNDKNMWKHLVITRFDLEDMTQNARYLLSDVGNSYLIITDDSDTFKDIKEAIISKEDEKVLKSMSEKLEKYKTIFELCKTVLFLPLYFEHYWDKVTTERHPTELSKTIKKGKWITRKDLVGPKEKVIYRNVSVLSGASELFPKNTFYKAPEIKINVSGYWKKISPDEIGQDKHGNPIHGRTWVEKVLTWAQEYKDPGALKVKRKSPEDELSYDSSDYPNRGYVYVMRSAAHDKDIYKIGMTRRTTDVRSDEISRHTGVPDKYLVIQDWEFNDCVKAEALIHEKLDRYRLSPNREFFKVKYKTITETFEEVLKELS